MSPLIRAGTGYSNTDQLKVSGGAVNAVAVVTTNTTGGITAITVSNPGSGFTNNGVISVSNSTGGNSAGSNATFTSVMKGKVGRITYETMVALKNMTS